MGLTNRRRGRWRAHSAADPDPPSCSADTRSCRGSPLIAALD